MSMVKIILLNASLSLQSQTVKS